MYRLVIADDQGHTREVAVTGDELTIGRNPGQGIRLEDQNISRIHTRLRIHSNCLLLDDLSRYGTLVNSIRVKGVHILRKGDQIQVGDYRITVKDLPEYLQGNENGDDAGSTQPRIVITGNDTYPAIGGGSHTTTLNNRLSGTRGNGAGGAHKHRINKPCLIQKALDGGLETRHLLENPEIFIGSAPDNHIILDHPTVNAKHAKILNNGSRFSLLACGQSVVTVNEEEIGAKDLESGDIIGVGALDLRFVLPGYEPVEDWENGANSTGRYRAATGRRTRLPIIIAAAVVGVLAIGLTLVFLPSSKDGEDKTGASGLAAKASKTKGTVGSVRGKSNGGDTIDFALEMNLDEDLNNPESATPKQALLSRINELMDERNWAGATDLVDRLLKENPDSEEATLLKTKIAEELTNRDLFRQLTELAAKNSLKEVMEVLARISPDSVYRPEAERIETEIKAEFIHNRLQAAEDAFNHQDYKWAIDYTDEILKVQNDNREAMRLKIRASLALKKADEAGEKKRQVAKPADDRSAKGTTTTASASATTTRSSTSSSDKAGGSATAGTVATGTAGDAPSGSTSRRGSSKAPSTSSSASKSPSQTQSGSTASGKSSGEDSASQAMSREAKKAQAEQFYAAGRSFFRQNNHQQARENLLKAIQLDPGLGDPHFYLGHIYLNENKIDMACSHLKKLLQISPASRLAPGTQDAVKRIGCQ